MRPQEIRLEGRLAQPDARPILSEMVPKLVPLGHQTSDQRLLTSQSVRDQEERRPRLLAPELGEDQGGRNRVRPIVDRQRHEPLVCRHPVQATRVPPGQTLTQPVRGGPEHRAGSHHQPACQGKTHPFSSPHLSRASTTVTSAPGLPARWCSSPCMEPRCMCLAPRFTGTTCGAAWTCLPTPRLQRAGRSIGTMCGDDPT